MRHWIKTHRRSALLVGITLAVPAYLFLLVLGQTLSVRAGYQDQIDTIEPRIARMQGLVEKEEALREALSGVNNVMNDHIYLETTDAAAVSASLQAEARRILGQSGMEVTNSQVLPVRKRDTFDYVSVKVVARGGTGSAGSKPRGLGAISPGHFYRVPRCVPEQKAASE